MTARRRSILEALDAIVLGGRLVAQAVREAEERKAAERHERFYGVDRTPPINFRDPPCPTPKP